MYAFPASRRSPDQTKAPSSITASDNEATDQRKRWAQVGSASEAAALGTKVAARLLEEGAAEVLDASRSESGNVGGLQP